MKSLSLVGSHFKNICLFFLQSLWSFIIQETSCCFPVTATEHSNMSTRRSQGFKNRLNHYSPKSWCTIRLHRSKDMSALVTMKPVSWGLHYILSIIRLCAKNSSWIFFRGQIFSFLSIWNQSLNGNWIMKDTSGDVKEVRCKCIDISTNVETLMIWAWHFIFFKY